MSPKCKCALQCTAGQARREKMFTTAVDSPVYCTQHPSLDANLNSWTKKILGDIKIQCAWVNMHVITVSPCAHCDRATPISGTAGSSVLVQSQPHNITEENGHKQTNTTLN